MVDTKRKANGGSGLGDEGDRAPKRRRVPNSDILAELAQGETPETTTRFGLQLLDSVRKTEDKSGRPVATNFLTLPSRKDLPDYYDVIKMPIAIDTIQAKLEREEFSNLSALESYFKRMVSNAKEYNQRGSEIYDDAERLRKALSNFMTKTNPAYKNIPGYTAVPTPIPEDATTPGSDEDAEGEADSEADVLPSKRRPRAARPSQARASPPRRSATVVVQDRQYVDAGFAGLTFQQAQEKIVLDMITHKEEDGDEFYTFEVFVNLPSRSLKDYYQVVHYPLSLKKLQKRVLGVHGRNEATGVSDFRSWQAFEDEATYIWENAWQYNEDRSEISNLAKDLRTFFKKLIHEARRTVTEPPAPKITLKVPPEPPKITLKLGRPAPVESPTLQTNGAVQSGQSAQNGSSRNPLPEPTASLNGVERGRSASAAVGSPAPSQITGAKHEVPQNNAPLSATSHGGYRTVNQTNLPPHLQSGAMLPPSTPGLGIVPNSQPQSSNTQSYSHHSNQVSNSGFDSKWRQPGKDASHALITNLTINTHHQLTIPRHFRMDVPPSDSLAQQSVAITLPATHFYIQIQPVLPDIRDRQYKLFVTAGNQRLHAVPSHLGHALDPRRPIFETRLNPGVNRIEVELIAALSKGAPKLPNGQDVELEKVTVFANVMRA